MSKQERVSWISLIVNLVIGFWYFGRVFRLPAGTDLFGPGMAIFAVNLIILSIFIGIASEVALRVAQKQVRGGESKDATGTDERDVLISLKSSRNAYGVLSAAIFLVLVLIALLEWTQRFWHSTPDPKTVLELLATGPLAPMHIAQLLLLALTLAGITVYVSRIFHYRRGF
jgi:hypothetical protein